MTREAAIRNYVEQCAHENTGKITREGFHFFGISFGNVTPDTDTITQLTLNALNSYKKKPKDLLVPYYVDRLANNPELFEDRAAKDLKDCFVELIKKIVQQSKNPKAVVDEKAVVDGKAAMDEKAVKYAKAVVDEKAKFLEAIGKNIDNQVEPMIAQILKFTVYENYSEESCTLIVKLLNARKENPTVTDARNTLDIIYDIANSFGKSSWLELAKNLNDFGLPIDAFSLDGITEMYDNEKPKRPSSYIMLDESKRKSSQLSVSPNELSSSSKRKVTQLIQNVPPYRPTATLSKLALYDADTLDPILDVETNSAGSASLDLSNIPDKSDIAVSPGKKSHGVLNRRISSYTVFNDLKDLAESFNQPTSSSQGTETGSTQPLSQSDPDTRKALSISQKETHKTSKHNTTRTSMARLEPIHHPVANDLASTSSSVSSRRTSMSQLDLFDLSAIDTSLQDIDAKQLSPKIGKSTS